MNTVEKLESKIFNRYEIPVIFSFFLLLVVLKAILVFPFKTPWILADEVVYSKLSESILKLIFLSDIKDAQMYPPGYSVFLSVANLLSPDKQSLYRNMLLINSVLSSSIIFPAYFLLKKYTSKFQALGGSLVISSLPSVVTYTFVVMSENLFVPLVLYSVWFLYESFENNKIQWNILAGISIFYLYFTRETGIVFIISLFISLIYFVWSAERKDGLNLLKSKMLLVFSSVLPTFGWVLYKTAKFSNGSLYDTSGYSSALVDSFSKTESFELFVLLLFNEVGYIIISAYVVFFILCVLFISDSIFKLRLIGLSEYVTKFGPKKAIALNSSIVYFFSFSAGLLLITVAHMKRYICNPDNFIFGRYLAPIIPVVFLFALIGIAVLQIKSNDVETKWKHKTLIFSSILVLLFLYYLPHTNYAFPNMFSIYYVIYLQKYMSYLLLLLLFAFFFVLIPLFLLKGIPNGKPLTLFFMFFVVISICFSIPTYQKQLENMGNTYNVNQIGRYLEHNSSDKTLILMDHENFGEYWGPQMWFLTQYWSNGEMVQRFTNDDLSGVATQENITDIDYIISKKLLPYDSVKTANNGYKLYDLNKSSQMFSNVEFPYLIDIGENDSDITEGFYESEMGENRWTTNFSKVKIGYDKHQGSFIMEVMMNAPRPQTNPANVTFYINGNLVGSIGGIIGEKNYSIIVPENCLEERYQILEIKTNTWKPSENGYVDDLRDLGVQIDWIRIDSPLNDI
ncbi:glycosyltransferase family 39 protein [uncultured Methanomethylovorans sp.]|uniref:glycosyltransferase family 39 protein n=1 Tax=uncultured Methanomethylovorans sp. TaxID=183759 RepID=UPI002AA76468|nr:glycosyltransferase family 39 protein [uncultured Methanomethylovorans sp.]